nr:AlpA family phage regulatory protein [uncultured Rhodoferax sp.]
MIISNPNKNPAGVLILRKKDTAAALRISVATLDRLRVKGDFPAPIKLGEQAVGWTMASVQTWIDSRPIAHHYSECIYIEEDGGDMRPGMEQYSRDHFATFIESMLQRMATHPQLAENLTDEEIAILWDFPAKIRAHRSPYINARPTDRIVDLMKSGRIGATWPTSKPQIEG